MIIVFASGKGGVGKSSLAVNCAALWAADGHNIALHDWDTQQAAIEFAPHLSGVQWPKELDGDGWHLIDTAPPSPMLRSPLERAIGLADVLILPVNDFAAHQANGQLGKWIEAARGNKPRLKVLYALTMLDFRASHYRNTEATLRAAYGAAVMPTVTTRATIWPDATYHKLPIHRFAPRHRAAAQMKSLAGELYNAIHNDTL